MLVFETVEVVLSMIDDVKTLLKEGRLIGEQTLGCFKTFGEFVEVDIGTSPSDFSSPDCFDESLERPEK